MSNITGLNFTFDHDVAATAPTTIYATNTPVNQVLSLVLQANQLSSKVVGGNSLLIYPKRQDKDTEYRDLVVRTFYLQNAQAAQVLAMLKQMVKTRDIVIDERTNSIIMRDAPETIKVAERLIAAMDVNSAEVVMEAQVLEVSATDLLQAGIQYPSRISFDVQPPATADDPNQRAPGLITLEQLRHLNSSDVIVRLGAPAVAIDMLQSQGKTKTLATPRIRVRSREKAKVLIGDRLPVVTTTLSSNFSTESVNYQDVGLTLEVAPVVVDDSDVQVKLKMEVSTVTDTITTSSGLVAYQIGTRTAETVMNVHNNQTQILAGLLQRNEHGSGQGLPGLSRLPLLDRLFGTRSDNESQTELILLLTPHIVCTQGLPAPNVVNFDSGTENRIGIERERALNGQSVVMPPAGVRTPPPPLESPGPPAAPAPRLPDRSTPAAVGNVATNPAKPASTDHE
jgi:general secretion pathway protein D